MSDDKSVIAVKTLALSSGKLFFFLCFAPCIITYWHIRHAIYANWDETIIVDVNTASISTLASGLYGRKASNSPSDEIIYYKLLKVGARSTNTAFGIYQADISDAADVSAAGKFEYNAANGEASFPYLAIISTPDQSNNTEPCIYISKGNRVCGNDAIRTTSKSLSKANNRPTKAKHWMQHVMFEIPATSLLILINCLLAFVYWNKRVPPEAVSKIYNRIIPSTLAVPLPTTTEIWRVLTGSTAHFEPLHLGMNMLSLSALGKELEGRQVFTSISFFMYNCSLIVIVATIWLGLQRIVQHHRPNTFDANSATVGYSGVLFAWMVVASLGQASTCPIIFVPNLCFPTYKFFGPLKFSFSPLIQLAVMQVILPRVSFTGHLSGIIAGFLIHWDLLPIRYFQPALFIPSMYLIYLWKFRNAFVKPEPVERSQGLNSRVKTIFGYQLILLFQSVIAFGPLSSTTLSFAITILYWYQLYQAMNQNEDSYNHVATWSKGYIFSAILVLISDGMTVGGWVGFSSWRVLPIIVIFVRSILLLASVVVALMTIPKLDDGIFELTLNYTVLHPSREIGKLCPWLGGDTLEQSVVSTTGISDRTGSAFVGVGHRLGGGSNSHKTNPWKVERDVESKA